jgi:ribose transport system substrate-binding protein
MKKLTSVLIMAALTASAALATACGGGSDEKTVEVFVQTADHGWTGAVQTYAQEKVDELNAEGNYNLNLTACESATDEAQKISDVLVHKDTVQGIVLLPIDNTMESTLEKLVSEEVYFVQFDRVISTDTIDNSEYLVSKVKGDNEGIGRATAEKFIEKGFATGDKVLIMPGDNSSVPVSRTKGFCDVMVEQGIWTQDEADNGTYYYATDYTGWSRSTSSTLFENFVGTGDYTEYPWIFTHDSEIALGILESLNSSRVGEDVKAWYKENLKILAASSGLDEMYAVMEGKHKTDYLSLIPNAYLFDVTYDPAMIQTAIQDMIDFLDGKTVEKNHTIAVNVVDASNVSEYQGFGTGDYRVS